MITEDELKEIEKIGKDHKWIIVTDGKKSSETNIFLWGKRVNRVQDLSLHATTEGHYHLNCRVIKLDKNGKPIMWGNEIATEHLND